MRIRLLLFLTILFGTSNNLLVTAADTYKDEVSIQFQMSSSDKEEETPKDDLFTPNDSSNNLSRLPQLGQMVTSVIVLLIGIILILIIIMLVLLKDIKRLKKIGDR